MWCLTLTVIVFYRALVQGNNLLQECAKYYRPKNYLDTLAAIKMPYIDQVPLPNNVQNLRNKGYLDKMKNIAPTPVITTKVLMVKTKYLYKNPVCVKYSRKQKLCKIDDGKNKGNVDKLVTKEHFLKNDVEERVESAVNVVSNDNNDNGDSMEPDRFSLKVSFDKLLEPSESDEADQSRAFRKTPPMKPEQINELLIEDGLDQLETILPDYRRRRTYETSTVFVTKTLTNKRSMATLVVKNCVPIGYDVCPRRQRSETISKRVQKDSDEEGLFYFG